MIPEPEPVAPVPAVVVAVDPPAVVAAPAAVVGLPAAVVAAPAVVAEAAVVDALFESLPHAARIPPVAARPPMAAMPWRNRRRPTGGISSGLIIELSPLVVNRPRTSRAVSRPALPRSVWCWSPPAGWAGGGSAR